jgi:hypothetical protein
MRSENDQVRGDVAIAPVLRALSKINRRMVRRSALGILFLAVFAVPGGASGRTTDVAFGWVVAPVAGTTQKWIRIENTDDNNSILLASVHGLTFNITSIVSVRASGGPTPNCTISTAATTFDYLYCSGNLPPDSSLILVVNTNGSGGDFEVAANDAYDPAALDYAPDTEIAPLLPATASLTKTPTTESVSFTSGGNAFDEVELLPYGLTVTKVDSITPAGSTCDLQGPGLDCNVDLAANATGTITFETAPGSSATPTADVVLTGDDGVGDAFVTQTQGAAPTYDLLTKAQPSVVTYKRGQKLAAHPIRFTVTNAAAATIASPPVALTETTSGTSALKLLGAKLSCQPNSPRTPALKPGQSAIACTIAFTPTRPVARNAGRLTVTLAAACASPEKACTNNRARATIIVK